MQEDKIQYVQYNSGNNEYARANRKNPTLAESVMWEKVLRKKQLWRKFTRQKPLWPFIADFYCASLMLAVEIDGSVHENSIVEDIHRTDVINDLWVVVVRYDNEQVINELESVISDLKMRCEVRERELL